MSMKYIVLEEGSLIIERWFGEICHETFVEHEKNQLEDDSIKPGTVSLVDTTESNFLSSIDRIPELYALYSQQKFQNRFKKIAIIVSDESFEKAKLFEQFAQESLESLFSQPVGYSSGMFLWNSTSKSWNPTDEWKKQEQSTLNTKRGSPCCYRTDFFSLRC